MLSSIVWDIRPEVFSFSPLPRWYGLLFATGVAAGYFLARKMFLRDGRDAEWVDRLLLYVIIGTVVGMRLGHTLFYQPDHYLRNPLDILKIWEGGFASHGGFLGVAIALFLFGRKHADGAFLWIADRVSVASMLPAGFIRLGNFFNSEMIGHPAEYPWTVVFAQVDQVARHPAQLYEAIGYFATVLVGWLLYSKTRLKEQPGRIFGFVMIMGFSWRFLMEFFKIDQVAFEEGMLLNMGQLLSLPPIAVAIVLAAGAIKGKQPA